MVTSEGTFIQGIIGIGGEKKGKIKVLVESPDKSASIDMLNIDCKDSIIVCGKYLSFDFYEKAKEIGVKGIICGGIDYDSISKILA